MKPLARTLMTLALLGLSACTNPMLSAEMSVGAGGLSVNPALSGDIGGATVSVEAN